MKKIEGLRYVNEADQLMLLLSIALIAMSGKNETALDAAYENMVRDLDKMVAREVRKASQVPTDMVDQIKGAASAAADREAKIAAMAQKSIEDPLK